MPRARAKKADAADAAETVFATGRGADGELYQETVPSAPAVKGAQVLPLSASLTPEEAALKAKFAGVQASGKSEADKPSSLEVMLGHGPEVQEHALPDGSSMNYIVDAPTIDGSIEIMQTLHLMRQAALEAHQGAMDKFEFKILQMQQLKHFARQILRHVSLDGDKLRKREMTAAEVGAFKEEELDFLLAEYAGAKMNAVGEA